MRRSARRGPYDSGAMATVGDRPGQAPALLKVMAADGPAPRIAVLPLALVSRSSADELARHLRERFGEEPLDFAVLGRPVALGADWRDNNVDHKTRLLAAWRVLEDL